MGKEYTVQEALKLAIQAEKDSMDFYRKAASITTNERAKKVFDLLANEEVGTPEGIFRPLQGGANSATCRTSWSLLPTEPIRP